LTASDIAPSLPLPEWADARYYDRDITEEGKHVWWTKVFLTIAGFALAMPAAAWLPFRRRKQEWRGK
jgi:hypothetical protein